MTRLGIPRSSVFVCTKYNPPDPCQEPGPTADEVYAQLQLSRERMAPLGYVDLMLLHQPRPGPVGRARAWEALGRVKGEGWVREIGVSNL